MIKLAVFDMDGVLVNARELHYQALNQALVEAGYPAITREEQATTYEALPTRQKLRIYSDKRGLPVEQQDAIAARKQEITLQMVSLLKLDEGKIEMLRQLQLDGIKIFCASNAVPESMAAMLKVTGLYDWIETRLSNKDVDNCKPHPEIYHKAMALAGVTPAETLIIEDSPVGKMAAVHSGAWLCEVSGPEEVTYARVRGQIDLVTGNAPKPLPDMNILIPMAGAGSRFAQAGYTFPKPLIEVRGKPMIEVVTKNLGASGQHIFVIQESHREKYALNYLLPLIQPGSKFVPVDRLTEGAACTTLLARGLINNDKPLLIANSDQFMDWDAEAFYRKMAVSDCDGAILTFHSHHPKWSYVKTDNNGYLTELAEKKPISDQATVGVYYWRRGSDYVRYAEQMIAKNVRTNNEFYVAPVYNEAVADGKKIIMFPIWKMWGLGTPEDLKHFLENHS